ncbi:hypothetical protein SAMN05421636_109197 [Pricia antarctica]|uniref:Uncharacterized protein n=1 Tax=Pricia antarctica TaxID=641691 RepID=A0A1G7HJN7_9FLAO|nr:hypothetical protein SAMN05421636_109197 [Pricia antarctica]
MTKQQMANRLGEIIISMEQTNDYIEKVKGEVDG